MDDQSRLGGFWLWGDVVEVDVLVACADKGLGSLALAETIDDEAGLADPRGQAREVAVARDKAEAVEAVRVQQVHRVDDHGGIGRVLALGVGELLDRLDRVVQERFLPSLEIRSRPVPICALDKCSAVLGDLSQKRACHLGRSVVGVDEHGKLCRAVTTSTHLFVWQALGVGTEG